MRDNSDQPSSQAASCAGSGSGFSSSQYASQYSPESAAAAQYSPGEYASSSVFCNNATSTLLSIVGGAALGGIIMYLLDPEEGPQRRHYVGDLAGGAWETVRDAAGNVYETVRDGAVGLGAATAAGTSSLASGAGRGTRRLGRGISESRMGRSVGQSTRRFRDETSGRMRYLVRGDERTDFVQSGMGEALAAVGLLALGVGSMYLLDGRQGTNRRNVLRQKFLSGFGRMATSMERLGRDAWNRSSGMVTELKNRRGEEFVDDRTIVERVRANVGHCVTGSLSHVDVTCINGRVTLRGSIPAHEVDNLLKCAWATRGVKEIVNQLNTGDAPGAAGTGGASTFSSERVTPAPAPMGSTISCPNPT